MGLKCPGVQEPKDGTGMEQFLGISQPGRLLGCGWSLVAGLGDEQMERDDGEMGRRSLEFQNFGNYRRDLLSSVQDCLCQAPCISLWVVS